MSTLKLKYKNHSIELYHGDAIEELKKLPSDSIQTCITSPPYYCQRDYGHLQQIGLETTLEQYISRLVEVFEEVRRVLKPDGTLWINIADTYVGGGRNKGNVKPSPKNTQKHMAETVGTIRAGGTLKHKDMLLVPFELAKALRDAGWYLRQDIIWQKPNCMPESVKDRCTRSYEHVFLFSKSQKYKFNYLAIQEPATYCDTVRGSAGVLGAMNAGKRIVAFQKLTNPNLKRNKRDVWTVATTPSKFKHYATFPMQLIEPMVLAATNEGDSILDPFMGTATTGEVTLLKKRKFVGIELVEQNFEICYKRLFSQIRNIAQEEKDEQIQDILLNQRP